MVPRKQCRMLAFWSVFRVFPFVVLFRSVISSLYISASLLQLLLPLGGFVFRFSCSVRLALHCLISIVSGTTAAFATYRMLRYLCLVGFDAVLVRQHLSGANNQLTLNVGAAVLDVGPVEIRRRLHTVRGDDEKNNSNAKTN